MKKRLLCLSLILVMILTSIPVFGDMSTTGVVDNDNIDTDGTLKSTTWFAKFDVLLGADKDLNGAKFYSCLNSLRDPKLLSDVQTVWNDLLDTERTLLGDYGLSAAKIHNIMMFYLNTYPIDMDYVRDYDIVTDYGDNIYADIYHEETLEYSRYMLRFFEYLNSQFDNLPDEMKNPTREWDALMNAGEIHQFQGMLNTLTEDGIILFKDVFNTTRGVFTSRIAEIPEDRLVLFENQLKHVASNGFTQPLSAQTIADIEEYASMYMLLGNVILESTKKNLIDSSTYGLAMELADTLELYDYRTESDPVRRDPAISVQPDGATIYFNPNLGAGETDNTLFIATVFNSTEDPVWSFDAEEGNGKILIDQDGRVTLDPAFEGDDEQTVTVTASITGASDSVEVIIVSNAAAGAIKFFGPYISGYPDGTFKEDNFITRAEIATMFARVLRLDVIDTEAVPVEYYKQEDFTEESFADVPTTHWAHMYIELLFNSGVISGTGEGDFKPDDPITRAQMATIIANSWDMLGIDVSALATHEIKDVDENHWAYDAIKQVYNGNIVTGNEDGTFGPEVKSSRLEVVKMINRVIGREDYRLPDGSFSDVPFSHNYYGTVESATRLQTIQEELE